MRVDESLETTIIKSKKERKKIIPLRVIKREIEDRSEKRKRTCHGSSKRKERNEEVLP
jgi:hypothetical protein